MTRAIHYLEFQQSLSLLRSLYNEDPPVGFIGFSRHLAFETVKSFKCRLPGKMKEGRNGTY
jgi:hypothetical protein